MATELFAGHDRKFAHSGFTDRTDRSGPVVGLEHERLYLPVLFFADDGLILSQSEFELKKLLNTLVAASEEVGLSINKEKSNIIIFNEKEKPKEIHGIGVTSEIRYLGVDINDGVDCFKTHKEKKIKMAQRMANLTYSVIARSCNKLMIGKTYWKGVVLPGLLYGSAVVNWSQKELEELQRTENRVWRCMLGAPNYAPVSVLRGEIGTSSMKSRDTKTKLKYMSWIKKTGNGLLNAVVEEMYELGKDKTMKTIKETMEVLKIAGLAELGSMKRVDIERVVNEHDKMCWRLELEQRTSVSLYFCWKKEIREEIFYENTEASVLLFRARSNTLQLGWRRRFQGGEVECQLCGGLVEETLDHFIKECSALEAVRVQHGMHDKSVEEVLLFNGFLTAEESKAYLLDIWRERERTVRLRQEEDRVAAGPQV